MIEAGELSLSIISLRVVGTLFKGYLNGFCTATTAFDSVLLITEGTA
jgi:hypothetical protein